LITDDPGTPGNRHWEINLPLTSDVGSDGASFETPIADLNYGVGEHLQLKFEVPWVVQTGDGKKPISGLGNSRPGVKWRFVDQEDHHVAISTYPQFTFNNPTSSVRRGLADDGYEFLLPVQVAHAFKRWEVNGDLGYNFRQYRQNQWLFGLAGGFKVTEKVELLAELHEAESGRFAHNDLVADAGLRWALSKRYTILLAAGRSLPPVTRDSSRFFSYTGIQLHL
jgi:hypothetical protein